MTLRGHSSVTGPGERPVVVVARIRDLSLLLRRRTDMRRRLGLALAVLCAIVLALLAGVGELSGSGGIGSLPPPSFHPSPAWLSLTAGSSNSLQATEPSVWALTARSDLAALAPFNFAGNLLHLSRTAIYISAGTAGRGGSNREFQRARWPLRLSGFQINRGWEGQPAPNVQERLRWAAVLGWRLDVRVYFASQHPSRRLLRAAQQELERLRLPGS
jgi:hypothetical protein